jgi:hypothetical protein
MEAVMPMNGFMELTEDELEIIDAGGLWGNVLIGGCTAVGTASGFFAGGIASAAVGTVTVPIFGTVAGGTVGAWAGAGTGAALATYWDI